MSKFRHECPDWAYREIDENDAEFEACTCELGPGAEELRERMRDEWLWSDGDEWNPDDLA